MALTKIDDRGLKTPIDLLDSESIRLGTGNDLQLYANGSNSYIQHSGDGDFYVQTGQTDEDLYLIAGSSVFIKPTGGADHGIKVLKNGGVELYYDGSKKFETRSDGAEVTGHLYLGGDNNTIILGNDSDMQLWHSGTHGYIYNKTGWGLLRSDNWQICDKEGVDVMANFKHDGAVELYYDNSKKLETDSNGVNITGQLDLTSNLSILDNSLITIGSGDDLQISHNGNNSYIKDTGTGELIIESTAGGVRFNSSSNATGLLFNPNTSIELYYDNSKKFETVADGIKVHGAVNFDNNELVSRNDGSSNIDHLWHSDATNTWHFCSDTTARDTGNSNIRCGSVTTNDINMSNLNALPNEVDGTKGSWTMQEGADDLFLINRSNGKKYKFNLTEVS